MQNASPSAPRLAHISPDGTRKQTIQAHLEAAAGLAEQFAEPFGGGEQARLAGLLHDIGKYSDAFQRRLAGSPQKVDHSTAGAVEAVNLRQGEVAFCVAGHHGGLPDGGSGTDAAGAPTLLGRLKKPLENYDGWKSEISLSAVRRPPLPRDNFTESFYIRMLYSCLVDADFLDTETFMNGEPAPRGGGSSPAVLLERLNHYVSCEAPWLNTETELNRKRAGILRACFEQGEAAVPGLFSLTVPTGGGKTISSLAFALAHAAAHGKRRVVYVIPYMSIIDQTADKFRSILDDENVLEHHSGAEYLLEENDVDSLSYRKALAAENWDAPVIVTTAVQFFESLFSNRPSRCRKLHNLAGSVIIFDEAQTLPVPYLRPCVAAIGQLVRHYGASAVLCTATQPALGPLFSELASGLTLREICPDTAGLYQFFRRTTLCQRGELTQEELARELNSVPQVLCVVNRRASAQQLYEQLDGEGRFCLTTLLCPDDRKRLLAEIRARLKDGLSCRVVSTSLIEAGVDVDFPAAWREEAGLDSILQTAGRCNREGKRSKEESIVSIFRLAESAPLPMLKQNIASTQNVLRRFDDPASPEAITEYFSFYRTLKGSAALDEQGILNALQNGVNGNGLPFATVAERFHLIDAPTVTVYIPVGDGAELLKQLCSGQISRQLYRKLGQYAVNVYPEHLAALQAAGAVEPVDSASYRLLDLNLYDDSTGLKRDVETGKGIML